MPTRSISNSARVPFAPPPEDLLSVEIPASEHQEGDFHTLDELYAPVAYQSPPTTECPHEGDIQFALEPRTPDRADYQKKTTTTRHQKLKATWLRLRASVSWLALYAAVNAAGFIWRFNCYPQDAAVWLWPAVAKGSAESILVNAVLAILFICYHSVTRLHVLLGSCSSPRVFKAVHTPVEQHVAFHRLAGAVVLLASVVHSLAWIAIIFKIRTCSEAQWNRSTYRHHQFLRDAELSELLAELPIWTGLLMLLCVAVATPFCLPCVRERSYRTFVLIHAIFLPFIGLLLVHGAACWMGALQAPYWLLFPVGLYLRECQQRRAIAFSETRVVSTDDSHRDIVILTLAKPSGFASKLKPGMFVFVQVPSISRLEWHPFSISSAPQDAALQLHIQQVGDWTRSLAMQLARDKSELVVRVNGPIGTSTGHLERYEAVVMVASGVGVTPFLSALRHILHTWRQELHAAGVAMHADEHSSSTPWKVHFVWITRQAHHLRWVLDTLDEFQDVLSSARFQDALEVRLHLTTTAIDSKDDEPEAPRCFRTHHSSPFVGCAYSSESPTVTLRHARPDWRALFAHVATQNAQHERVAVFICANNELSKRLKREVAVCNAERAASNAPRLDAFAESF